MSEPSPPSPDRRLADPAFRAALLSKVESLIAVLEIARRKVHRNLRNPESDKERLHRILDNLQNTLSVCRRAQVALVQADANADLGTGKAPRVDHRMSRGEFLELHSLGEYRRFQNMGPISDDEVEDVDLDGLCDQLGRDLDL